MRKLLISLFICFSLIGSTPIPFSFFKPPSSSGSSDPILTVTSGLVARWEADNIVGLSNSNAVSTWPDISGNGYNMTQAVGGNQPQFRTSIFGTKPAVKFDGTDDYLINVSLPTLTNFTVFMVEQIPADIVNKYQVGTMLWYRAGIAGFAMNGDGGTPGNLAGAHITVYNSAGTETANKRMSSLPGSGWVYGTKHLVTWTYNGTTVTGRADGATHTLADFDGGFGVGILNNIGWHYTYSQSYTPAILVYDRVLSAEDITLVETYLNTKFPCF